MNGRQPQEPLVYTVPQVAALLGLGVRTVRRMVADGELPVLTGVGRRTLIPRTPLRLWIENNTQGGNNSHVPD